MRTSARRLLAVAQATAWSNASPAIALLQAATLPATAWTAPCALGSATQRRQASGDTAGGAVAADAPAADGPASPPPYRLRSPADAALDEGVVHFAERLFASGPEPSVDEARAEPTGALLRDVEPAAQPAAAGEHVDSAAAAAAYMQRARLSARKEQLRADAVARLQLFSSWVDARAEPVAAFRAAAAARGLDAEPLLAFVHAAEADVLLRRAAAAHGAGDEGDGEPAAAGPLRAAAAMDAAAALLSSLGLPASAHSPVLARCPSLLLRLPTHEALYALSDTLGGRAALAAAVPRNPRLLSLTPQRLERRLALLALHLHSAEAAARAAAEHPELLTVPDKQIEANARFLGSLVPQRPFETVVRRFPQLLCCHLEARLSALAARAPPELAGADLRLVASQQPTLLLRPPGRILRTWSQLAWACGAVPAWRDQLATLAAPMPARAQLEWREAAATAGGDGGAGSDGDGGGSGGDGGEGVPGHEGAQGAGGQPPAWFHQDDAAAAVGATPGAYGSRRRGWRDADRLRARELARLLDTPPWQRQRLVYVAEAAPEQAGGLDVLGLVLQPRAEFEARFPGFPAWLAERREAWQQARDERRAAAAAAGVPPEGADPAAPPAAAEPVQP